MIDMQAKGFKAFQLLFRLPYYAWRTSAYSYEDPRGLRNVTNLSFFGGDKGRTSFLYEAQASCLITGSDDWTWDGFCFSDGYFDPPQDEETAAQYYPDPFTLGTTGTDTQPRDPRTYFLLVLGSRLDQACREWDRVVRELDHNIKYYEKVC